MGFARLVDSKGPFTDAELTANSGRHAVSPERLRLPDLQKYRHAWVMEHATRLKVPVRYEHPKGAVIWINLGENTSRQIEAATL